MKRLVRSDGYLRFKLVTGAIFVVLGAILIGRTLSATGPRFEAIPAVVLGLALIGLGYVRYREYFQSRGRAS